MPAFDIQISAAGPTVAFESIYNSFHHHQQPSLYQPILKHLIDQPQQLTNTGTGIGTTATATTGGGSVGGAVGVIGGGGGGGATSSGATTFGGTTYYGDGTSAGGGGGGGVGVMSAGYGGPLGGGGGNSGVSNHGGGGISSLPVAFATAYGMQQQQQQQPDGLGSHHNSLVGNIGLGGFVGHPPPPPPHLSGLAVGMPGGVSAITLGGALGGGGNLLSGNGGWGGAGTTPERISSNRPRRDRSSYQQQHQQHPQQQQHQTPTRVDHRHIFGSVFNNNTNNLLQTTPSMDRGNAILSGQLGGMVGGTRRRVIDEDAYGNFGDVDVGGHNQHSSAFPNSLSSIHQNLGIANHHHSSSHHHLHSDPPVHHSFHQVHDLSLERCRNVFLKSDESGSNTNSGATFASSSSTTNATNAEHAKKPKWEVLEIVGNVRNLSPQIFQLQQLTCLVVCNNQLITLSSDIRHLVNLEHLNIAHNRIKVLPPAIGDLVLMREFIASGNLVRSLPPEMGRLFKLNVLELTGNPLTPETLAAFSEGVSNLLTTLQNGLDVDAVPPPPREWLPAELPLSFRERTGMMMLNNPQQHTRITVPLRVLCYNILCPHYCSRQLYGYCPSWALKWDYRVRGIQLELKGCSADLLCLQEVETGSYHKTFQPKLSEFGYDSEFTPKTRARTMQMPQDRVQVDGCAVFWRRNKFQMLDKRTLEFSQLAMQYANGNTDMLNRVMTRDNVASVVLLRVKHSWFEERRRRRLETKQKYHHHHHDDNKENKAGTNKKSGSVSELDREKDSASTFSAAGDNSADDDNDAGEDWGDDDEDDSVPPEEMCPFLIAISAHFHWDPDYCDVKLIQAIMLTSEVRRLILEWSQKFLKSDDADSDAFPVVMCGDLNSLPDSGVIDFLRSGSVSTRHEDFRRIDYNSALKPLSHRQAIPERITHGFKFWDVYHIAGKPLKFTNYTFDFQGLIDYIFVSQSIKVTGVLGPIDSGWTRDQHVVGFPHPHVPSDHLPLMSTLRVPLLDKLSPKAVQLLKAQQQLAAKASAGGANAAAAVNGTATLNGSGSNNNTADAAGNTTPNGNNNINHHSSLNGYDRQSSGSSSSTVSSGSDRQPEIYYDANSSSEFAAAAAVDEHDKQTSLSAASSALSLEGIVLEDVYAENENNNNVGAEIADISATTAELSTSTNSTSSPLPYMSLSASSDAVMIPSSTNMIADDEEADEVDGSSTRMSDAERQSKFCTSVEQQENNEMLSIDDVDGAVLYGPHPDEYYDEDSVALQHYAAAFYQQQQQQHQHESAESVSQRYEHFSESVGLSPAKFSSNKGQHYSTPAGCTNFTQSPQSPAVFGGKKNTQFIPNLVQLARSACIAAHGGSQATSSEALASASSSSSPSPSSLVLSPAEANENEQHHQRWNYFDGVPVDDVNSSPTFNHHDASTMSR